MRWLACLMLALTLLAPAAASAEPRLALVVGNGSYAGGAARPLANPAADAELVAEKLRSAGFDVSLVVDADLATFKAAVGEFGGRLRAAGPEATGLFFYAGHAVQSFGANYLLPTDVTVTDAADLDLVALEASSILRQMSSARNRTNVFILDACRNNPFEAVRGIDDNGLAEMRAPPGSFLAFATAPGDVAFDGAGAHSPFSEALAAEMLAPGATIEEVFRKVRIAVVDATAGRQIPWDSSSLTREVRFMPAAGTAEDFEARLWGNVAASRDPAQLRLFIEAFPDSRFVTAAREMLAVVAPAEPSATAAAPAERDVASVAREAGGTLLLRRADPAAAPAGDAVAAVPSPPGPAGGSPAPDPAEIAAFEAARRSRSVADYEAFLVRFPGGVFAEIARIELTALKAAAPGAAPVPAAAATVPASPEQMPAAAAPATPPAPVLFAAPLADADPNLSGRSLAELIAGSPVFPPIEGLPAAVWQGKRCHDCHQWKKDNLCVQAQTYTLPQNAAMLNRPHPLGVAFKSVLQRWAAAGCP